MSLTHTLSFGWTENNAGSITQPVAVTGQLESNASEQVQSESANAIGLAWNSAKLQSIFLTSDQNLTFTTNGTQQLNTATVVAASGCTANGSMTVTVTSAILSGSPVTYNVPVTTASTTAALVAAVCRAYLQTQAALTALYEVGGTGATITLTALLPAANDSTLNIATATGTASGITTESTSTNTTSGVAPQDTITITASQPFVWYRGSGISYPFGGSVTSTCFTNYGATVANLVAKTLLTSP